MIEIRNYKQKRIFKNPISQWDEIEEFIFKHGTVKDFLVNFAKAGFETFFLPESQVNEKVKAIKSKPILEKFAPLKEFCEKENIGMRGIIYMHGLTESEIKEMVSKPDFTSDNYKKALRKRICIGVDKESEEKEFQRLTTIHEDLKFHVTDCIIFDNENLNHIERLKKVFTQIQLMNPELLKLVVQPGNQSIVNIEGLKQWYDLSQRKEWKGLILTHFNR